MTGREVLFGLHQTDGIGWQTIEKVVRHMEGALNELPDYSQTDIDAMPLTPDKKRLVHQGSRLEWIEDRLALHRKRGVRFVTVLDDDYPEWLIQIHDRPWVLYWLGRYSLVEQPVLGIVGTRVPTSYGRRIARELAAEMSALGWHIASGLARGIDSEAHLGGLDHPGSTIAVLGTPVDTAYPSDNYRLYERIKQDGLLVSEYPLGMTLKKGMFPLRNRIISGLAAGVLVVEADNNSGSLITAKHAEDQNRELFAVPGPISSPQSAGTNDLIRRGAASLIACRDDILDAFNLKHHGYSKPPIVYLERQQDANDLADDERMLLHFVSDVPVSFDRLYELTQFDFGHLHAVLLSLLMKKRIEQQPGSSYILQY